MQNLVFFHCFNTFSLVTAACILLLLQKYTIGYCCILSTCTINHCCNLGNCCMSFVTVGTTCTLLQLHPLFTAANTCPELLLLVLYHYCNIFPFLTATWPLSLLQHFLLGNCSMSFITVETTCPLLLLHALCHCCTSLSSVTASCLLSLLEHLAFCYCR